MKLSPNVRSRRLRREHRPDAVPPVADPAGGPAHDPEAPHMEHDAAGSGRRGEMAEIEADRRAERRLFTQALLALGVVGILVVAALAALP